MTRTTGQYRTTELGGEQVRAFTPAPLPPSHPAHVLDGNLAELHATATAALARLAVAGMMVPSPGIRKNTIVVSRPCAPRVIGRGGPPIFSNACGRRRTTALPRHNASSPC